MNEARTRANEEVRHWVHEDGSEDVEPHAPESLPDEGTNEAPPGFVVGVTIWVLLRSVTSPNAARGYHDT